MWANKLFIQHGFTNLNIRHINILQHKGSCQVTFHSLLTIQSVQTNAKVKYIDQSDNSVWLDFQYLMI